jgi:hypothetical protein
MYRDYEDIVVTYVEDTSKYEHDKHINEIIKHMELSGKVLIFINVTASISTGASCDNSAIVTQLIHGILKKENKCIKI